MRAKCLTAVLALCLGVMPLAAADSAVANPDDVAGLYKTLGGSNIVEAPRGVTTSAGFLRFVGAPPGGYFETGALTKGVVDAEDAAKGFMRDHAGAFAMPSAGVDYETERFTETDGRSYVRLQQTYSGVPVFGAQATVQLNDVKNVVCVLSDVMRDTTRLDNGAVGLTPSVTPDDAQAAAVAAVGADYPGQNFLPSSPELMLYDPAVLGKVGQTCLVWRMTVRCLDDAPVNDVVLVNAHGGGVALRYPLVVNARNRKIYDSDNTTATPGTLTRSEGDGESGIEQVDTAYDYFGDVYDFYYNEHGRDSINNNGMTLNATVRWCQSTTNCPTANAFWYGGLNWMFFGDGFVVDDVAGHELTHGVTSYTSGLIYQDESGAINEAFSDIWGEFIDLTNGRGTDTAAVRWLCGEDIPGIGAIRSLKNPPAYGNWFSDVIGNYLPMPDRYMGAGWYSGTEDNGGVHHNMGVGSKLAYLLTDGDDFNGFGIAGLGISAVADLFYEVQVNLIPSGADYIDLGQCLLQAAENLSWSEADCDNLVSACRAVEILEKGQSLRNLRATPIENDGVVALTWDPPTTATTPEQRRVDIVRRTDRFPQTATDGTVLATNCEEDRYVDGAVTPLPLGAEYYYGVFLVSGGDLPVFARVVVGDPTPDYVSEGFVAGSDLAFTQITIRPVVDLAAAQGSNRPMSYTNYSNYIATVRDGSAYDNMLPVSSEDSYQLPMTDDGYVSFTIADTPFPLFGELFTRLTLSSNGFVVPTQYIADAVYMTDVGSSVAVLENHYDVPRISFLYADLDPRSGGRVWAKFLDDRMVVTFDNVPEYGSPYGNTVQCELFYNGEMRFTYLNLGVNRAVVGLSDGNGLPLDPIDVKNDVAEPAVLMSDLTGLAVQAPFELVPIPTQYATEGETLEFLVEAESAFVPVTFELLEVPSDLTSASFTYVDDTSSQFSWKPSSSSESMYSVLIKASAGGYVATQYVTIYVTDVPIPPVASDLTVTPAEPRDGQQLVGTYTYAQGQGLPEGGTIFYWFRNGAFIPALAGFQTVPAEATSVGQTWHFTVTPVTYAGVDPDTFESVFIYGETQVSPLVTILADVIPDTNKDGKINSVDVQQVVNGALGLNPGGATDVDGDGQTTAVDVQHVLNAALAGGAG